MRAAPTGGVTVTLSSSSAAGTVPSSVKVAAGSTTRHFHHLHFVSGIHHSGYPHGHLQRREQNHHSDHRALCRVWLSRRSLLSRRVSPADTSLTGTVTISPAAPAGGIAIELWTTGTVAFVSDNVTVPAGSTTATFTITTNYTTTTLKDTITAFYNGVSKTAAVTVTP